MPIRKSTNFRRHTPHFIIILIVSSHGTIAKQRSAGFPIKVGYIHLGRGGGLPRPNVRPKAATTSAPRPNLEKIVNFAPADRHA